MSRTIDLSERPKYFEQLNENDKDEYQKLRVKLNSPAWKNRRNRSLETFQNIIDVVKNFAI